jgi:RNA polymerase sigma-70 factor (family 1)
MVTDANKADRHFEEIFNNLYKQYAGKLYGFAMRITGGDTYQSEEIVQNTFIKIWERRATIQTKDKSFSLLCTIARNIMLNTCEHRTVELIYQDYIKRNAYQQIPMTDDDANFNFLNEYIDRIVDNMPSQRRNVFILSKKKNLSNEEIAKELNISSSNVSTQLSLAINYIRKWIGKHYDDILLLMISATLINQK